MNVGEASEIYLKAYLLREKAKGGTNTVFKKIREISDDANLAKIKWNPKAEKFLSGYDVESLAETLQISKASPRSKADISINGTSYSLKEMRGSPPAIVNHTARPGFETACSETGTKIGTLDKIISEYWKKRKSGKIKEDVSNSESMSPFLKHKEYMRPIINYFVFTGTGSGISIHLAEKILEINYRNLPNEMKIIEKNDYFDAVWPKLVFSVRSKKGMPSKYPDCDNFDSISIWTKMFQGDYRGALHIRTKK